MAPPLNNKNNNKFEKLKKLGLIEEAYESYCRHLETGKVRDSWYFDHPDLKLTAETLEKHMKENPIDFPAIKKQIAHAKGYAHWEDLVEQHAQGKNKCITPAIQMVMRNKFGWDKQTKEESRVPESFDAILKILKPTDNK